MRPGTVARFLVGGGWELDVSDVIDKITLKKKKNLERNNLDIRHKNLALFAEIQVLSSCWVWKLVQQIFYNLSLLEYNSLTSSLYLVCTRG